MSRTAGALLLIALAVVAAVYAGSPLLAFEQLKAAAMAGDKDRLAALVDFPAVRENLKTQVDSKVVRLAREASGVGVLPVLAFGKLGSALGDRAIDRLVTPEAIAAMVTQGRNPRLHGRKPDALPQAQGGEARPVIQYAYLSPDQFRVSLSPADHPEASVALIMDRHGLFSWRVEALELPKSS